MKVFPVVHINDHHIAVEQAHVALGLGADGVYLISHGGGRDNVLDVLNLVRRTAPTSFLGVNLLGQSTESALRRIHEYGLDTGIFADGLWSDDIMDDQARPSGAMHYKAAHPELAGVDLLGGVAFKYTPTYTDDPIAAAAAAHQSEPFVDVVTTSGPGTGMPPLPAKIAAMKHAIGKPLAVASGIGLDNIDDYAGIVDQLLVASSVETEPYSGIFAATKLAEFITVAHDTE